ncbi:MAG: hypothetical protein ABIR15_10615 [Chitinophagaceae bacterium]
MGLSKHTGNGNLIQQELNQLEEKLILLEGKLIKPSQCYHFSQDPLHILYNTNCPEDLMEKIEAIIVKYKNTDKTDATDESRA